MLHVPHAPYAGLRPREQLTQCTKPKSRIPCVPCVPSHAGLEPRELSRLQITMAGLHHAHLARIYGEPLFLKSARVAFLHANFIALQAPSYIRTCQDPYIK